MVLNESNYYSQEANNAYMSVSLYKQFAGTYGRPGCEYHAMKMLSGEWKDEPSDAMLIGSYVDAWMDGEATFKAFKDSHPEMCKKDGSLYQKYAIADTVIDRISQDTYFMTTISGEPQKIMTGHLFGADWKIKIDSYIPGAAIVDLKVVKSLREKKWVKDIGYLDFIDYWGYDIQGAVYQEIVRQNTGERLPFFISAVSKEKYPDFEVISIPQIKLDEALRHVEWHMNRIMEVKNGAEPDRCGVCDCCRANKKLEHFIMQDDLLSAV